jgi:uroporphyrin-III C-methyltransferase
VGRKWVVEEFKGFEDFSGIGLEEPIVGVKERPDAIVRGHSYRRELDV